MVGRYALYGEIARGGMATVYFGRLLGPVGFSRTVAIKRLHPHYASDAEFVAMFLDEARLAARVQHPNVVSTLDVVALDGELMLVMEYVQGESLSRLMSACRAANVRIPYRIVGALINSVLTGLHAAHEAKNERSEPLGIVHRDMSPQNVLVGADGNVRVFDFGIAKAAGRAQDTREGQFKGKLAYASPEQLGGAAVDRRVDIYAASVILWELVTNRRMFKADDEMSLLAMVREGRIEPPSQHCGDLPAGLEAIIMRGLATEPTFRFNTAREMAIALEEVLPQGSVREVAEWVGRVAKTKLDERARRIEEIETNTPVIMSDSGVRDLPTLVRNSLPPSSISSSRPMAAVEANPPPKQRRGLLLLALLLIGGAVVSGVVLATRTTAEPTVVQEPQTGGAPKASKAKEKQPEVAQPAEPEPTQVAAVPAPPKHAAGATKTAAPKASASPAPPPSAVAPATNCSPPFTIDQDGIRHPKPECM